METGHSSTQSVDPAFSSAVERRYIAELRRRVEEMGPDFGKDLEAMHRDILDTAIYKSSGSGGLRFKALADKSALEARLFQALQKALRKPER